MVIEEYFNTDKSVLLKTFVIAEVGQAHDGSLGTAHAYIDALAEIGVDAVKFQTHIASAESTLDEKFRVNFSKQDNTRYDYWKRMEFTHKQWQELYNHATDVGLIFLSSVFSIEAIELMQDIGVTLWKLGSGEIQDRYLLDRIMQTHKPVLISTGMSNWSEIDDLVNYLNKANYKYALFQCTSEYPTSTKSVGLNIIDELNKKYTCAVGFSDHSGQIYAPIVSMTKGVRFLEMHITFDKRMFGPDTSSSLTFDDMELVVKARDEIFSMLSNPVDKDIYAFQLAKTKNLFSKSIALKKNLKKGEVLHEDSITAKKPGGGIPYADRSLIIGKKLKSSVFANRLLQWDDIEDS